MSKIKNYIYKELPKLCEPDDFLGQVKRTVNGKPVSQEQIDIIIAAITNGLKLKKMMCYLIWVVETVRSRRPRLMKYLNITG
jgi:hypothetical protein